MIGAGCNAASQRLTLSSRTSVLEQAPTPRHSRHGNLDLTRNYLVWVPLDALRSQPKKGGTRLDNAPPLRLLAASLAPLLQVHDANVHAKCLSSSIFGVAESTCMLTGVVGRSRWCFQWRASKFFNKGALSVRNHQKRRFSTSPTSRPVRAPSSHGVANRIPGGRRRHARRSWLFLHQGLRTLISVCASVSNLFRQIQQRIRVRKLSAFGLKTKTRHISTRKRLEPVTVVESQATVLALPCPLICLASAFCFLDPPS